MQNLTFWWPLVTSILVWAKKMTLAFRISLLKAFERRLSRFSNPLSFREYRGGHFDPPPPTMAKLADTPTRARVNIIPWNFRGNTRTISGDTAFWACNVIYESPCTYLFSVQSSDVTPAVRLFDIAVICYASFCAHFVLNVIFSLSSLKLDREFPVARKLNHFLR